MHPKCPNARGIENRKSRAEQHNQRQYIDTTKVNDKKMCPKRPKSKIIQALRKSRPTIGGTKTQNKKTDPICSGHQVVQNGQNKNPLKMVSGRNGRTLERIQRRKLKN